jgi:hypothetical protein
MMAGRRGLMRASLALMPGGRVPRAAAADHGLL